MTGGLAGSPGGAAWRPAPLETVSERRLLRIGQGVLLGTFVLLLGIVLVGAAQGGDLTYLLVPAALPIAVATLVVLFRHPLLNLAAVLSLVVSLFASKPGFQIFEVLYAPYYLLYLIHYFGTRLFVYRTEIAPHWVDKCMLAFLTGIMLSVGLTVLHGGKFLMLAKEMSAIILLGFYFPVREAVAKDRRAVPVLVGVLLWLMIFVAVRNLVNYRELVADAVLADVVGGRRVDTTNSVLLVGGIVVIGLLSVARRLRHVVGLIALLLPLFTALVITQSRAVWVVMMLAVVLTIPFGRSAQRRRIIVFTTIAVLIGTVIFLAFTEGKAGVIAASFARRFLTLRSAATRDLSLISRIYEAKGVWAYIAQNPILGYGLGVPYTYFDIITQTTIQKTFIHNAFIALLYRYGVWGLPLVMAVWFGAIGRAFGAFRRAPLNSLDGGLAFGCFLVLLGLLVYANTANPLYQDDAVLMFAISTGLASGLDARTRNPPLT